MLIVKTIVKQSPLEGIELFAGEKIPKGSTIWKFDPVFDIMFDPTDVEKMPARHQKLINRYAYLSRNTGKYVYPIDDSRFTNHSATNANMIDVAFPGEVETRGIAARDIQNGEEILIDYRTIDAADAKSTEAYLRN
jgi:uncharacterized protein